MSNPPPQWLTDWVRAEPAHKWLADWLKTEKLSPDEGREMLMAVGHCFDAKMSFRDTRSLLKRELGIKITREIYEQVRRMKNLPPTESDQGDT